jgi:hypothetical protein
MSKQENGELISRIGKKVHFGPPRDRRGSQGRSGKVVDEVWEKPLGAHNEIGIHSPRDGVKCWGDYAFLSELIRWDLGGYSIRIGYCRRRCGEPNWRFVAQYTIEADPKTVQSLLEKTLSKKHWFDK